MVILMLYAAITVYTCRDAVIHIGIPVKLE